MNIGIIGYGAIGRDVADRIRRKTVDGIELQAILVRRPPEDTVSCEVHQDIGSFLTSDVDIVVESAGQDAVRDYAIPILQSGRSLVVTSVGAMADVSFTRDVLMAAKETNTKVYFPSCAIAGLDRVAAAREGSISRVTLTTRKPPQAWIGTEVEERLDLYHLAEPVLVYEGPATEAAKRFPQSVNVSVALAIASVGVERTEVKVYVDQSIEANVHNVHVEGDFGYLDVVISNTPSANPKTGVIVAMSVMKVLRGLVDPFVIGI